MIEIKLSKSAFTETGTVRPLVLRATSTAKVMAQALYDQAHADRVKVNFSARGTAAIPDEYMRKVGSRFTSRDGWKRAGKIVLVGEKVWYWKSSETWHKIARKDDRSFDRSGGMWSGLRVRNFGQKGAIIEFAGRTVGQSMKKVVRRDRKGNTRAEYKEQKVTNALKAWSVFSSKSINLMQPQPALQQEFEAAVEIVVATWLGKSLQGNSVTGLPPATGHAKQFATALAAE